MKTDMYRAGQVDMSQSEKAVEPSTCERPSDYVITSHLGPQFSTLHGQMIKKLMLIDSARLGWMGNYLALVQDVWVSALPPSQ